jgi:hypothetical protein
MKVGAERNKVILLAIVSAVAAYAIYSQLMVGGGPTPARPPRPAAQQASGAAKTATRGRTPRPPAGRVRGGSFRPKFGSGESDEPLDPMSVDPTLRTDLLALVRGVEFQGVERNLFQFTERKKKVEPPSPEQVAEAQKRLQSAPKPKPAPKTGSTASQKTKAPPIKFKYYGFANEPGDKRKRAFLLDGEDILVGREGDIFKKRYKIIRIGINSIVMKDLQFDDDQTLRLEKMPG